MTNREILAQGFYDQLIEQGLDEEAARMIADEWVRDAEEREAEPREE